jgi:hypothetical protein
MFRSKKVLTLLSITLCVSVVLIVTAFWKTNVSSGVTDLEVLNQEINNGLTEINLPTSNNLNAINSAADNFANFVNYRSGVQINQTNKDLLKSTEQNFRTGSKKITPAQLSQILTDVTLERLPNLTNIDIGNATESLKGFTAPDLPLRFQQGRNNVTLRANGEGAMPASTFQSEVTGIRDSGTNKFMQSAISSRISLEVERKVNMLSDASPENFGNAKSSLTPLQAMLITYSVVTDDPLAYNQSGLNQKMQNTQQGISQAIGGPYSSPANQRAFGENGYLYSSPANLVLNDATIARILNLIAERGF